MSGENGSTAITPVKSTDRALAILESLASSHRRRSAIELARELGIPKSSLHEIVRTMQMRGWVTVDDTGTGISLGLRSLLVGTAYVHDDDIVGAAGPAMDWLSEQTGEAVHFARLDRTDVTYLAKRDSVYPLRLFSAIGRRLPAHATALGKALLAARADDDVDRLLHWPLERLTQNTLVERDALVAELRQTRARGYAVDAEENTLGIRCVAIALPVAEPPVDALSVSVPVPRFDHGAEARLAGLLAEARAQIVAAVESRREPPAGSPKRDVASLAASGESSRGPLIATDPRMMGGRPVIAGTKVPVSLVLECLAAGMTADEVVAEYPNLTVPAVRAAAAYGAALTRGEDPLGAVPNAR